jgi:hypothetical protein
MRKDMKLLQWFVIVSALAALAASGAQAGTRPNDRAGMLGVGAQRIAPDTSDVVSRYLRSHAPRPNDPAGSLGVNPTYASVPDVFERYASAHPYGAGLAATSVVATAGFRWSDYGAGVGTGIVAVLLLIGGLLATPTRRRQRTQPAIGR